jgi:CRISPR-associated protein Csx17
MLEGTLVFAGGVSRRLEGASPAYLSYPFTVRAAGAGFGTASFEEQAEARGELWAPLWTRPATYAEVRALFREGRLAVGARPARDGLDAARAVSDLATDRRIAAFERYGFVKRQGLSFLAAPLGRRVVRPNPSAELLTDLDRGGWLDSLRRKAESGEASADLRGAVRGLEDAAFALLERPHDLSAVQATLVAIGRTGRVVAQRPKLRDGVASIAPPPRLSGAWIVAADDGTPAFRLAVALAGVRARLATENRSDNGNGTSGAVSTERRFGLPMCAHLGPLDPDAFPSRPRWSVEKGSALATWGSGSLVDNLCAFARRRLLEWTRLGLDEAPFDGANGADSGEIAAFLDGPEMDSRIAELVLGLSWVEPARWSGERRAAAMPFAYTTLKPLFTPRSVFERLGHETLDLPMPPALAALLAAGRLVDAVRLAQERARASGLPTPFLGRREPPAQSRPTNILLGRRLLAALVIPIRDGVVAACLDQAYPSSDQEPRHAS